MSIAGAGDGGFGGDGADGGSGGDAGDADGDIEIPGVDGGDGENLLFEDLDDDGDVDIDDFILYVEDLLAP